MDKNKQAVVLIVDDSAANLVTAKRVLDRHGYTVLTAESGKQALQTVETEAVDLILMDIMMPEMNGFDTCSRLKNDERFANIPVIFLTALGDTDSMAQGFDVGGIDYIVKPFQRIELVIKIKNHLELSLFHRMHNEFIRKMNDENSSLKNENNHLLSVLDSLPQHLLAPVSKIEAIVKHLSAHSNLQDDQETRNALEDALASLDQLKTAVDVIDKLHAH